MGETNVKSPYELKPWLQLYTPGLPATFAPSPRDGLSLFREAVARAPDKPAVLYFDGRLTYAELDAMSSALAAALVERGFVEGDRLAIYMQNMPPFLIAVLAGVEGARNCRAGQSDEPAARAHRRFRRQRTQGAGLPGQLFSEVVEASARRSRRPPYRHHGLAARPANPLRSSPVCVGGRKAAKAGAERPAALMNRFRGREPPPWPDDKPEDIAFLVYTSGTTGVPRRAMTTHAQCRLQPRSRSRAGNIRSKDGDADIWPRALVSHYRHFRPSRDVLASQAAPLILSLSLRAGRRARRAGRAQAGVDGQRHHRLHRADEPSRLYAVAIREPARSSSPAARRFRRAWSRNSRAARAITFTRATA